MINRNNVFWGYLKFKDMLHGRLMGGRFKYVTKVSFFSSQTNTQGHQNRLVWKHQLLNRWWVDVIYSFIFDSIQSSAGVGRIRGGRVTIKAIVRLRTIGETEPLEPMNLWASWKVCCWCSRESIFQHQRAWCFMVLKRSGCWIGVGVLSVVHVACLLRARKDRVWRGEVLVQTWLHPCTSLRPR